MVKLNTKNETTKEFRMWKCLRCSHNWIPKVIGKKPKHCPKCKSPYWSKPRQKELQYYLTKNYSF